MNKNEKIKELLERGVENIYPNRDFLEKELKSGRQLKLYAGFDPTADTLHIGNGIALLKLKQFQDLGHKVIMLIGDFTAMIGDPTDKLAVRKQLTREEILNNCKNYQKQASTILNFDGENPAELVYNSEWLAKMNFSDVVNLASNFTVQQMLERDMFEKRIKEEKPVYLHEFLYPLMQGYDSVAMDVDGEVGGNDQTFNMLAGRTLLKSLKNKEKFVLTMKLLADENGKKMGKSEGNMIALKDFPNDMYGKVMSWGDGVIGVGFDICTVVGIGEVEKIKEDLKNQSVNPRDLKMKLAYEITEMYHGEDEAKKAQENFIALFQKKEIPDDILELQTKVGSKLIDVLLENKIVSSKTDFRRLVDENAISVDGEKIDDKDYLIAKEVIVKVGKKRFVRIKV